MSLSSSTERVNGRYRLWGRKQIQKVRSFVLFLYFLVSCFICSFVVFVCLFVLLCSLFLLSLHSSCFPCLPALELKAADSHHIRDNQSAAKCAFVSSYYRLLLSSLYGVSVCTVFYFLIYLHNSVCMCVGTCTEHAVSVLMCVTLLLIYMQPSTFIYFTNLSDVCVIFSCHTGIVKLVYSSSVCVFVALCDAD